MSTTLGRRVLLSGIVLAANVAAQAYSLPVTDYIRHKSTSVTTDLGLRLIYFALMVIVTFVEVLLVDELLFGGGWRKRVLKGTKDPKHAAGEDDEPISKASILFKDYTIHVTLAFGALLACNYFLFNAFNNNFDSYYRKVGHLITKIRSSDRAVRLKAIAEVASNRYKPVSRILLDRLIRGEGEEQTWAAWALGYRAEWKLVPSNIRTEVERRLLALLGKGARSEQANTAVALARLESYRWLDQASSALREADPDPRLIVAIGLLKDHRPQSIEALAHLLTKGSFLQSASAAWALGKMQVETAADPLRRVLFGLDTPLQCIAVEALGRLGDVNSVSLLIRLFESKKAGQLCPETAVKLRPDGKGDDYFLFFWKSELYKKLRCTSTREPLRVRILKVLWRMGERRILPWIRKIAESHLYAPRVKTCAVRVYNMSVGD